MVQLRVSILGEASRVGRELAKQVCHLGVISVKSDMIHISYQRRQEHPRCYTSYHERAEDTQSLEEATNISEQVEEAVDPPGVLLHSVIEPELGLEVSSRIDGVDLHLFDKVGRYECLLHHLNRVRYLQQMVIELGYVVVQQNFTPCV